MRLLLCLPLLLAFGCASTSTAHRATASTEEATACSCGMDGSCTCEGGCTCSHD